MMDRFEYDCTYEMCFDGEIGSLVSLDARGHLPDAEVELFMATVVVEEVGDRDDEPLTFGIEVSHLWRREHPFVPDDGDEHEEEYEKRWTYSYSADETEGSIAVTKFEIASPWSAPRLHPHGPRLERNRRTHEFDEEGVDYYPILCANHPDRTASTGYPEHQVIDPEFVLDGYVNMCSECSASFSQRLSEARKRVRETL